MEKPSKSLDPRAIFFDLGGVVVDVDIVPARELFAQSSEFSTVDFDRIFFESNIKKNMDIGAMSAEEGLKRAHDLCDQAVSIQTLRQCWNHIVTPRPKVTELIANISAHVRCAVISNTDPIHAAYIEAECGIERYIESWTYSFDTQSLKPDSKIYIKALETMALAPEHAVFIDDRSENLEAAQALGIDAIMFDTLTNVESALMSRTLLNPQ